MAKNGGVIKWVVLVGFAVVSAGAYMKTKGLRNNNPGNLKRTGDRWQGLASVQSDPVFFQFTHEKWGIRAMAVTLINYQQVHGLERVKDIIHRWAPPSDNNPTSKYAEFVAKKLGFNSVEDRFHVPTYIKPLIKAIIQFENGINPYSDATIDQGLSLV